MKKISITFLFALISMAGISQNSDYYYYNGKKVKININKEKVFLIYKENSNLNTSLLDPELVTNKIAWETKNNVKYNGVNYPAKNLAAIIDDPLIEDVEPIIGNDFPVPVSNLFYVKLLDQKDTLLLRTAALETGAEVLRKLELTKKWYALRVNKNSYGNSIETSNYFFETKLAEKKMSRKFDYPGSKMGTIK